MGTKHKTQAGRELAALRLLREGHFQEAQQALTVAELAAGSFTNSLREHMGVTEGDVVQVQFRDDGTIVLSNPHPEAKA